MKTSVGTVIYPGCEPYLDEMVASLLAQTDRDFTLLVLDDGCNRSEVFAAFGEKILLRRAHAATPAGCRRELMQMAADMAVDALVLADADDRLGNNRVAESKRILADHPAMANELVLFGDAVPEPRPMLAGRFRDGADIGIADLRDANCLGMSNTAIRLDCVGDILSPAMDGVVAFDWAFFTALLLRGGSVRLSLAAETLYRQHETNIASPVDLSDAAIARAVAVKAQHYAMFSHAGPWYRDAAAQFRSIAMRLSAEDGFRRRYCDAARRHAPARPLWWEAARGCAELGIDG